MMKINVNWQYRISIALQIAKNYTDAVVDAAVAVVGKVWTIQNTSWDASTGAFPAGEGIKKGYTYAISAPGTVDGIDFQTTDILVSIQDGPSTSVYAGNWHKIDSSNAVLSVNSRTGVVTGLLEAGDFTEILNQQVTEFVPYTGTTQTLALTDAGMYKLVEINNISANTLTIPPNADVAFPIGSIVNVQSIGEGQTTLVEGSGVTIQYPTGTGLKMIDKNSAVTLIKRGTNTWRVIGRLSA